MPYSDYGYSDEGYSKDDHVLSNPSVGIVSIPRSFVLNGVDITNNIGGAEIIRENGKQYATLSCSVNDYLIDSTYIRNRNILLHVEIGSDSYDFILHDVHSDYKGSYDIIARTSGCLLDFPYVVSNSSVYSGVSNDIIIDLADNIPIAIETPSFTLTGNSVVFEGTPIEAISKLIDVCGGTMYYKNGYIVMANRFSISSTTPKIVFDDKYLISKDLSDNYTGSPLVKKITFNDTSSQSVISEPLITMIVSDCEIPYFLLNPTPINSNNITSNLGTLIFSLKEQVFETRLDSSSEIVVGGGINTIQFITHGGVLIDPINYSFTLGYNVIELSAKYTGLIQVRYTTKAIVSYDYYGQYDVDSKLYIFNITYLSQMIEQGITKCDQKTDLGLCSVEMYGGLGLDTPTYYDVEGVVSNIAFITDTSAPLVTYSGYLTYGLVDTTFIDTISTQVGLVDRTISSVVVDMSMNTDLPVCYGFIVDKGFTYKSATIGSLVLDLNIYTKNGTYDILYFITPLHLNYTVVLTYELEVTRYLIPPITKENALMTMDWYMCNEIYSFTYPSIADSGLCIIPVDVVLDVAGQLSVSPEIASGATITFDGNAYTVSPSGTIDITITDNAQYTIDTSVIRKGSNIYIDTTEASTSSSDFQDAIPKPILTQN